MTKREAPLRAAIVAVGDELLRGAHPDLNSPVLGGVLLDSGVELARAVVCGDDEDELSQLMAELMRTYDYVFTSGGLGPTLDDITRHAAARALGARLELSDAALEQVRVHWSRRQLEMPASNERQALVPAGSHVIANAVGTAPGFRAQKDGHWLICMPGPPSEFASMLKLELQPWLESSLGCARPEEHKLHLYGLSESVFAEMADAWMDRSANPRMGVTAKAGHLSVYLRAQGMDRAQARQLLRGRVEAFRARFERHLFGEGADDRLERVIVARLAQRGLTVTSAESCTGGMISARLTDVPGSSAVFHEGRVTYANSAKTKLLGVPAELLERHGAVSIEVAEAMARGAQSASGADLALSVTGVAGPDGGSPEKPVGLVIFGLATEQECISFARQFPNLGRDWIRAAATNYGLYAIWNQLEGRRPS